MALPALHQAMVPHGPPHHPTTLPRLRPSRPFADLRESPGSATHLEGQEAAPHLPLEIQGAWCYTPPVGPQKTVVAVSPGSMWLQKTAGGCGALRPLPCLGA